MNNPLLNEGKDSDYVNCYSQVCKEDYFNNSNNIKNWFLSRFEYKQYISKNDIPKIEIRNLKEQYILEEGISNKLSEVKFREELCKIDGFNIGGNFIKKNSNGFYELSHWVEIPIK